MIIRIKKINQHRLRLSAVSAFRKRHLLSINPTLCVSVSVNKVLSTDNSGYYIINNIANSCCQFYLET